MEIKLSISSPTSKSFTVKGDTIEEVFNSLNKNGYWGRYRSNESQSSKFGDDRKTVVEIELSASPTITLPNWSGYGKATKEEKKSWDVMYKALDKHENNHHTIFEDAAKAWKKQMEKDGDVEKKVSDKAWAEFVKSVQKLQDGYDTKTKNGEKEGVVLEQP